MANELPIPLNFTLTIHSEQIDSSDLDRLARSLRRELLDLDVEKVDFLTPGEAPPGSKSAEALTLGTLVVTTLPVFVPKLIEFLQSWVIRAEDRKVKIKSQVGDRSIELEYSPKAIGPEELKTLINTLSVSLEEKSTDD
ncbi:MAG: hypothetical protein P8Y03_28010 [Anaerolineales bacterium]|jgi:hypothetical protein